MGLRLYKACAAHHATGAETKDASRSADPSCDLGLSATWRQRRAPPPPPLPSPALLPSRTRSAATALVRSLRVSADAAAAATIELLTPSGPIRRRRRR
eukprot:scaffold2220_cov377-Prasinococcus_capsulatus_cf.AAC.11